MEKNTVNAAYKELEGTIYGYPIRDLLAFAIACREQGIDNSELHHFVDNLQFALDYVYGEMETLFMRAGLFGEEKV